MTKADVNGASDTEAAKAAGKRMVMSVSELHQAIRYLRIAGTDDKFLKSLTGNSKYIAVHPEFVASLRRHVEAAPEPVKPPIDTVPTTPVRGHS